MNIKRLPPMVHIHPAFEQAMRCQLLDIAVRRVLKRYPLWDAKSLLWAAEDRRYLVPWAIKTEFQAVHRELLSTAYLPTS